MSKSRILLIEFNELSPALMQKWMAAGLLPNFKAMHDQSVTFVSESDTLDPKELEPWIQWYSLHTGLSYEQHGVFHLTDGPKKRFDDIFSTLVANGRTVGCFGSMNVRRFEGQGSFFVSDPWCDGEIAYPADLTPFQKFVAQNVKEYSNSDRTDAVSKAEFLSFMLKNGLSVRTTANILNQLMQEKMKDPKLSWQRVFSLDDFSLDVFSSLYRRYRPDFSTFFSNSTAHLQHSYWRQMDPAPFTVKPSAKDLERYGTAIQQGYQRMDAMIGRLMALTHPDDLVVFATALSQQPYLRKEAIGGQHFYRLTDVGSFMTMLGIKPNKVEPVMTHQFMARFENAQDASNAAERLRSVHVDGAPAIDLHDHGSDGIMFGLQLSSIQREGAIVTSRFVNQSLSLSDIAYLIDGMKSGCHHPDGILWFRTGTHRDAGRCSILDVYPTLLDLYGLAGKIGSDRHGKSLVGMLGNLERGAAAQYGFAA